MLRRPTELVEEVVGAVVVFRESEVGEQAAKRSGG